MADVKISALPASTTPLDGTEVLPIVQGTTTKQVSIANVTAGRSVGATSFIPSGSTIPTNGVYLPAANAVGIATNSTNAIYINSSQQIALGTTPSGSYKFLVNGTAYANAMTFATGGQLINLNGDASGVSFVGGTALNNNASISLYSRTNGNSNVIQFQYGNSSAAIESARFDANGYLLIGYTSSNGAYRLQVNSQIFATSSTIATSDGRFKENVTPLSSTLNLVNKLNPVTFTWTQNQNLSGVKNPKYDPKNIDDKEKEWLRTPHNFPSGVTLGFIAQEVQEVLKDTPYVDNLVKKNIQEAVKDSDGKLIAPASEFLGIAEGNMIALLTKALQELNAKFDAYVASHP